jgi:hypothetical protein
MIKVITEYVFRYSIEKGLLTNGKPFFYFGGIGMRNLFLSVELQYKYTKKTFFPKRRRF